MRAITKILNHRITFWLLLCVPGISMAMGLVSGRVSPENLLHPSGEFAARFLIIAMVITPLQMLFPRRSWPRWLMLRRRALGVAAFCYAVAHTILYIVDMATLQAMFDEFLALGIWTGWVAFAIFIPLAFTSNEWALRRMRRAWQALHRWIYPAAILTLVHWIFVHNNLAPALVHFLPLLALEIYRITTLRRRRISA
jgi:methionine sulfoxide reductase heme-binding subunit